MDLRIDRLIREAALQWLNHLTRANPNRVIYYRETLFAVPQLPELEKIRALSAQNGIWKPKQMSACLSLLSSCQQAYNDHISNGLLSYKYRAHGGYHHSDNRSLRLAMNHQLPLLYFRGIDSGKYIVEVVLARQEAPDKKGVILEILNKEMSISTDGSKLIAKDSAINMQYATYEAQRRLHQAEFRQRVLKAYRSQCAICHLKHRELLDAAHIIPDSKGGKPEISNGLSLCRIHHGAYDQNILGIDPDYRVHINKDILEEKDGPMLKHGLQEMNQLLIHYPKKHEDHPDRDNLAKRYSAFLSA